MRRACLILFGLIGVLPAGRSVNAASPSFDCSKPENSAEGIVCQDDALAALDRETARLFVLARDGARMTPVHRKELIAMQRGFIKGRDDCWKANDSRACIVDNYVIRIHELRRDYPDARTLVADGGSVGPLAVRCQGLSTALSATFVNVGAMYVYLTWPDQQSAILTQALSGSGARYVGPLGGGEAEFWEKGRTALLALPGRPQTACTVGAPG